MLPVLFMVGNQGKLREMWCCPLPKGLGTSQVPHGLVYTGQPHRDWVGKQ